MAHKITWFLIVSTVWWQFGQSTSQCDLKFTVVSLIFVAINFHGEFNSNSQLKENPEFLMIAQQINIFCFLETGI